MTGNTAKEVIIYSTPGCNVCKRARAYLDKKGVSYQEIDITASDDDMRRMIQRSGQLSTPVIFVGEQMMLGFNQKKMDRMLAQ